MSELPSRSRMPRMSDRLADNLQRVTEEISTACAHAGRSPSDVTLIAVTKYAELSWMRGLVELGVRDLAESRPQQLIERATEVSVRGAGFQPAKTNGCNESGQVENVPHVRWHMIGHLQRNKVKPLLPRTALIHSVDSLRLLERIAEIAAELSLRPRVLLEINVSGESAKDGFSIADLTSQWDALQAVPNVDIVGLMTMAPLTADPEAARPVFSSLRQLREELTTRAAPHVKLTELSMGMSGDFVVAIEEGATLVRIGSRLFEGLEDGHSCPSLP